MKSEPALDLAIQAKQLSRHFGDLKAIDKLDLNIDRNRIYGFLGPNGCGKTTAIRMLTGLLKPTSGEIQVLGLTLPQEAEKLRLKIGYMTQRFSLYNDLTVKENLQFIAKIYGISGIAQKKRISKLLSIYGLNNKQQTTTVSRKHEWRSTATPSFSFSNLT